MSEAVLNARQTKIFGKLQEVVATQFLTKYKTTVGEIGGLIAATFVKKVNDFESFYEFRCWNCGVYTVKKHKATSCFHHPDGYVMCFDHILTCNPCIKKYENYQTLTSIADEDLLEEDEIPNMTIVNEDWICWCCGNVHSYPLSQKERIELTPCHQCKKDVFSKILDIPAEKIHFIPSFLKEIARICVGLEKLIPMIRPLDYQKWIDDEQEKATRHCIQTGVMIAQKALSSSSSYRLKKDIEGIQRVCENEGKTVIVSTDVTNGFNAVDQEATVHNHNIMKHKYEREQRRQERKQQYAQALFHEDFMNSGQTLTRLIDENPSMVHEIFIMKLMNMI